MPTIIVDRHCTVCKHSWKAPNNKGACPKCHTPEAFVVSAEPRDVSHKIPRI